MAPYGRDFDHIASGIPSDAPFACLTYAEPRGHGHAAHERASRRSGNGALIRLEVYLASRTGYAPVHAMAIMFTLSSAVPRHAMLTIKLMMRVMLIMQRIRPMIVLL